MAARQTCEEIKTTNITNTENKTYGNSNPSNNHDDNMNLKTEKDVEKIDLDNSKDDDTKNRKGTSHVGENDDGNDNDSNVNYYHSNNTINSIGNDNGNNTGCEIIFKAKRRVSAVNSNNVVNGLKENVENNNMDIPDNDLIDDNQSMKKRKISHNVDDTHSVNDSHNNDFNNHNIINQKNDMITTSSSQMNNNISTKSSNLDFGDKKHKNTNGNSNISKNESIVDEYDSTDIIIKNELDNELLKISFTDEMWGRLLEPPGCSSHIDIGSVASDDVDVNINASAIGTDTINEYSLKERSSYGLKYNFSLKDKANEAAVDAPEWLVPQVKESVVFWYGRV